MNAEIVSVGTELLLGQIVDTHAPTMARILAECGVACTRRATIGDNLERLVSALKESLSRADVVVTIGGLGPTVDDLTRDAIAEALGDKLVHMPDYEDQLRAFVASRGFRWVESLARQAYRPESAEPIANPFGTAPGLCARKNDKIVLALPGPKGEFNPMANGPVREILAHAQGGVIHSRTLRIVGLGESHVEELVRHLMDSDQPTVAPYAHPGEVHLRITAKADSVADAEAIIAPVEAEIRQILGDRVFGMDVTSLEETLVGILTRRQETIVVAESMTAGALAARFGSVPGASNVLLGGWVTYSEKAKQDLLGIETALLAEHGPVSESVAAAMALAARQKLDATYALAITGNAGPTADQGDAPVGLVFTALAGPNGVKVEQSRYRSERGETQRRATQTALVMLRDLLMSESSEPTKLPPAR
jgi:nicotinamide-nucleotide amidase